MAKPATPPATSGAFHLPFQPLPPAVASALPIATAAQAVSLMIGLEIQFLVKADILIPSL